MIAHPCPARPFANVDRLHFALHFNFAGICITTEEVASNQQLLYRIASYSIPFALTIRFSHIGGFVKNRDVVDQWVCLLAAPGGFDSADFETRFRFKWVGVRAGSLSGVIFTLREIESIMRGRRLNVECR